MTLQCDGAKLKFEKKDKVEKLILLLVLKRLVASAVLVCLLWSVHQRVLPSIWLCMVSVSLWISHFLIQEGLVCVGL